MNIVELQYVIGRIVNFIFGPCFSPFYPFPHEFISSLRYIRRHASIVGSTIWPIMHRFRMLIHLLCTMLFASGQCVSNSMISVISYLTGNARIIGDQSPPVWFRVYTFWSVIDKKTEGGKKLLHHHGGSSFTSSQSVNLSMM